MQAFLQSKEAQWVIWTAVLAILVFIGLFVIKKVRSQYFGHDPDLADHLTDFRSLREQGELSEAEFRRIKRTVASKLDEPPLPELSTQDPKPPGGGERRSPKPRDDRSGNSRGGHSDGEDTSHGDA